MKRLGKRILVIGDTQCKPGVDLSYMELVGRYIVEKRPDIVVHIGDHFDFESLSSYDRGRKAAEGRRLVADIEAGQEGMRRLFKPLRALQAQQRRFRKRVYQPRLVFCEGNHEDRFNRVAEEQPALEGFVGTKTLKLEQYGWEVYPFLKPVEIEGIYFVHYLQNPMNGRPRSGSAASQLKAVGSSFVAGHKQVLDIAIGDNQLDGRFRLGLINGACYEHDEAYKGYQGNDHFRGVVMLGEVEDGFAIPVPVSLRYLRAKYEGETE